MRRDKPNLFWAERGELVSAPYICFWGQRPYSGGVLFELTLAQARRMGLAGLRPGAGCYVTISIARGKP